MNEKHFEALSAFFDGEPVDCELLRESLAEPGAAELLVEFAAMRSHVQQDASRPASGFAESMHARLERIRPKHALRDCLAPLALAASLVLVAGLVGFRIGSRGSARGVPPSTSQVDARAAVPVETARAPVTDRASSPRPPQTLVTAGGRGSGEPPAFSLRMRMARWQDVSSPEETGRR